jgi:phage/plasmid-associated DNA primase
MDKTRNGVAIVIQGEQGSGKSFIMDDCVKPLIGKQYYYYTCKPSDIAGDHAEGMPNKLIGTIDEVNAKTSFDIAELLKSFITQTTLTVNAKGIRPYDVQNWIRFWFTTNRKTPIKIELGDRRYCVLVMLNTHLNDKKYYANLSKYIQRPEVLSAWYDHLMSLNVKEYDFCGNRPQSKMYHEIIEACMSNVMKFMADMILQIENKFMEHDKEMPEDHIDKVSANSLFKLYADWKTRTNHKDEINSTSFGREVGAVIGVTKECKSDGHYYVIDVKALKQYFAERNLFGYGNFGKKEVTDIDKLNDIIKLQQLEINRLRALLEPSKDKVKINFHENDNNDDNDYIDRSITINFFKSNKQEDESVRN